jgi:hypothetical protein
MVHMSLIYRHGCGDNEPIEFDGPEGTQNENASGEAGPVGLGSVLLE